MVIYEKIENFPTHIIYLEDALRNPHNKKDIKTAIERGLEKTSQYYKKKTIENMKIVLNEKGVEGFIEGLKNYRKGYFELYI